MSEGHTERLEAALDGKYRIESKLGEGGMASVYLAEDIKHKHKVALKILRPELAAVIGADRFLAEIQTTANLQHPHILALFDSGEAAGYLYYVMPYIEGETLRDKLDREKQLGVEESVRIARHVADALDYAHRAGVIHRDIKPGNILLHDGRPVVADFGIALAVSAAGGGRMTETGLSLGTPHYMSPEQASADRDLSSKSDVYSLGCVLYEMLAGQPPHTGPSAQSILVHILTKEATPLTELRHTVPPHVAATVAKSIEKLPADRFESAKAFMEALGDEGFVYQPRTRVDPGATGQSLPLSVSQRKWSPLVIGLSASTVVFGGIAGWSLLRPDSVPPVTRQILSMEGWEGDALFGRRAALAPDGSSMVLPIVSASGGVQLGLKTRGSTEITPIPGTEDGIDVAYSPDAQWIAYRMGAEIVKRPIVGGSQVTVAEDANPSGVTALAWLEDGTILYEAEDESLPQRPRWISHITEDGQRLTELVFPLEEEIHGPAWVHGLPGGRGALVSSCTGAGGCAAADARLYAVNLEDLSSQLVAEQVIRAWYVRTGHIVYVRADGAVFGQAFDVGSFQLSGSVIPLFDRVNVPVTYADMLLADDGAVLYMEGSGAVGVYEPVWVDRLGEAGPIDPGWTVEADPTWSSVALSPDDSRLAISLINETETWDLWIKQLDTGPLRRLTLDGNGNRRPSWSVDGDVLRFVRGANDSTEAVEAPWDGTGEVTSLISSADIGRGSLNEVLMTSDGAWLIYRAGSTTYAQNPDIYLMEIGVDSVGEPLLAEDYVEWSPALSSDDRWLAYTSDESGRQEVYVRPFPEVGTGKWQVSRDGGRNPRWANRGPELFFQDLDAGFIAVEVDTAGEFRPVRQEVLFELDGYLGRAGGHPVYDVSADDQRFVMLRLDQAREAGRLVSVQNFFEELRERMGEN